MNFFLTLDDFAQLISFYYDPDFMILMKQLTHPHIYLLNFYLYLPRNYLYLISILFACLYYSCTTQLCILVDLYYDSVDMLICICDYLYRPLEGGKPFHFLQLPQSKIIHSKQNYHHLQNKTNWNKKITGKLIQSLI